MVRLDIVMLDSFALSWHLRAVQYIHHQQQKPKLMCYNVDYAYFTFNVPNFKFKYY